MRPTTSTAGQAELLAASNPANVARYAGEVDMSPDADRAAARPAASPACRVRFGGSRGALPVATEPKVASTGVVAVREAQNTSAGRASPALTEAHR